MTRIYTCNVPIEADLVDAFCWLQKGFTDQFVYYDKQRACRYMGLGRCIALPSLRDVEYEYGEGSSLHEVATGEAAADQPPVFFSFNRFDATIPLGRRADGVVPAAAVHAAGNRAHRERARAAFAGELAGTGVPRPRGPLHAHGGFRAAPPARGRSVRA